VKAALIPPIHHLDEFGDGSFHLLLAHLLTSPRYRAHYKRQRANGAYLVLDNSAHEQGSGQDPATLLKAGFDLDAQEIVVPDVLDDAGATIEFCLSAHEEWFENGAAGDMLDVYSPMFMYVPQGNSVADWAECLYSLIRIHEYCARKYSLRRDIVIGVSKDYDVWPGGLRRLIAEYIVPQRNRLEHHGVKMNVHMLGWSRNLWNLQDIARLHPWIRSTDSAKPFVYAIDKIKLLPFVGLTPPPYPKRNKNYFSHKMSRAQRAYARENVWVFRQAAEGILK
jgi:hypothetical protein